MITYPATPPSWGLFSMVKASQAQEVALERVRRRNPVYATPFVLGGAGRSHALTADQSAYLPANSRVSDAGLDLKYGISSNLTLDATYNTDFAQVEADDQQVNLTRFSLFYPEKRLFFQERASVFDFEMGGNDRLFYSRRIGLSGGQPVPIHGGARIVGRVGSWDLGMLDMQSEQFGTLPSQNFAVGRVRRQVLNENSYVGGIVTNRQGAGADNLALGLDGLFRLRRRDYLSINLAGTHSGESPNGDPLDRAFVRVRWERRGTDGLGYAVDVSRAGVEFSPEMGFLLRRDYFRIGDRISYGWRPGRESRLLRHALSLRGSAYRRNSDGMIETANFGPEWTMETKTGHSLSIGANAMEEDLERQFRLGSDAMVPPGRYRFASGGVSYTPPNAALLRAAVGVEAGTFYDGWQAIARVSPTWNASRHLELGGSYQLNRVQLPERDQQFTAQIARLRTRVMLSTRFSTAGFIQYNSALDALSSNFRIRYNPREGNDLYIVYNAGLNTDPTGFTPIRPLMDNHILMIKYSRTFGLEI